MSLINLILYIVASCLIVVTIILQWSHSYWRRRNIAYEPPTFLFGNIQDVIFMKRTFSDIINDLYYKYDQYRYFGIYLLRRPALFIREPELIKSIVLTHSDYFLDNSIHVNEAADSLFGKNPFILNGGRWKLVRRQLTPALTPAKIKCMFPSMELVSKTLITFVNKNIDSFSNGINMREIALRYTTEVFGLCGFSINAQAFNNDNTNAKFTQISKYIFESSSYFQFVSFLLMVINPDIAHFLRFKMIDKEVTNFFRNFTKEILKYRIENGIKINDYFHHLMELRDTCKEYDFNEEHIAAQILTLFLDGIDTSSSVLASALHEIAKNEYVFIKLRSEIDSVLEKYNGELTYNGLQEMKYLDSCFSETIRKNVPALMMLRTCTKSFKFPSTKKNPLNGNDEFTLFVEKGIPVLIPIHALHNDPKYYPNPNSFNPERFSDENKDSLVPYTYFPFGAGPRSCLGTRYATLQIKVAIATIIKNFDLQLNEVMKNGPISITVPSVFLVPSEKYILNVHPRGVIYKT